MKKGLHSFAGDRALRNHESGRLAAACAARAHAILHVGGNAVSANDRPLVAKTASLALTKHHSASLAACTNCNLNGSIDAPSAAGFRHNPIARGRSVTERRAFERATKPAERRRRLLRDFVVEGAFAPLTSIRPRRA
jgi:hypothetical protein